MRNVSRKFVKKIKTNIYWFSMATMVTGMHLSVISALPVVLDLVWETVCIF
jgi:hypothetical protein